MCLQCDTLSQKDDEDPPGFRHVEVDANGNLASCCRSSIKTIVCNNCHGYHCDEICQRKCRFTGIQPPPKNIYLSIRDAAAQATKWRNSEAHKTQEAIETKVKTLKNFIKQLQQAEMAVYFGKTPEAETIKDMGPEQKQNRLQQIVFQKAQADPMVRQTLLDCQKQGAVLDANLEMLATAAIKLHQDEKKQAAERAKQMQQEIAHQKAQVANKYLNMEPSPPSAPGPPIPDSKSDYQEKVFFDEIIGPKSYGRHIIGQVIGQGGSNRTRMESESGCRVFFKGMGTERDHVPIQSKYFDPFDQRYDFLRFTIKFLRFCIKSSILMTTDDDQNFIPEHLSLKFVLSFLGLRMII